MPTKWVILSLLVPFSLASTSRVAQAETPPPPPQLASIAGYVLVDVNGDGVAKRFSDMPASTIVELERGDCVKEVYTASTNIAGEGFFQFADVPPEEYTLVVWWNGEFENAEAAGTPLESTLRSSQQRIDIKLSLREENVGQFQEILILLGSQREETGPGPVALEGTVPAGERVVVGVKEAMMQSPGSVRGHVIQDLEEDGVCGQGDREAQTLVQLVADPAGTAKSVADLVTDDSGTFEFTAAPEGEYYVRTWWSPGIISGEAGGTRVMAAEQGQFLDVPVSVFADGTVSATDLVILVKPKSPGLIPYPIAVGSGGPLPVGRVQVGQVQLPTTGAKPSTAGWLLPVLLTAVGLSTVVVTTIVLSLEKERRNRF